MNDYEYILTSNLNIEKKSFYNKYRCLFYAIFAILIFALLTICYIFIKPDYYLGNNVKIVNIAFISSFILLLLFSIVLKVKKFISTNVFIGLLFVLSIILKFRYMINTPAYENQYDTFTTGDPNGHFYYALSFYLTNKLPTTYISESDIYQFYHPPLNAIIQGNFMKLFKPIVEKITMYDIYGYFKPMLEEGFTYQEAKDMFNLYSTNQILSCFYMIISSFIFYKTAILFTKSDKSKIIVAVFFFFFPRLIQLSGQLNNDALCLFFSSFALYFNCIYWKKKRNIGIIILDALSIGLAMMAKLNGATIAIPMFFVFLFVLFDEIDKVKNVHYPKKRILTLVIHYIVFLLIACPLGLWWSVYSNKVLGLPFGYVYNGLPDSLLVSQYSFVERFVYPIGLGDFSRGAFAYSYNDYNLSTYLTKSALFGEFVYDNALITSWICLVLAFALRLIFIICFITYLFKKQKTRKIDSLYAFIIIISELVMCFYLNIKMPYGCSMDFRYIVPIILGYSIFFIRFNDDNAKANKFLKGCNKALNVTIILFALSVSVVYLTSL